MANLFIETCQWLEAHPGILFQEIDKLVISGRPRNLGRLKMDAVEKWLRSLDRSISSGEDEGDRCIERIRATFFATLESRLKAAGR